MEGIGKGGGAANSKDVSGAASDWRTAEARSRPVGVRRGPERKCIGWTLT